MFIADGFYKFLFNYENSKLNYSEIKNLCSYLMHRIKTGVIFNLLENFHVGHSSIS